MKYCKDQCICSSCQICCWQHHNWPIDIGKPCPSVVVHLLCGSGQVCMPVFACGRFPFVVLPSCSQLLQANRHKWGKPQQMISKPKQYMPFRANIGVFCGRAYRKVVGPILWIACLYCKHRRVLCHWDIVRDLIANALSSIRSRYVAIRWLLLIRLYWCWILAEGDILEHAKILSRHHLFAIAIAPVSVSRNLIIVKLLLSDLAHKIWNWYWKCKLNLLAHFGQWPYKTKARSHQEQYL